MIGTYIAIRTDNFYKGKYHLRRKVISPPVTNEQTMLLGLRSLIEQ